MPNTEQLCHGPTFHKSLCVCNRRLWSVQQRLYARGLARYGTLGNGDNGGAAARVCCPRLCCHCSERPTRARPVHVLGVNCSKKAQVGRAVQRRVQRRVQGHVQDFVQDYVHLDRVRVGARDECDCCRPQNRTGGRTEVRAPSDLPSALGHLHCLVLLHGQVPSIARGGFVYATLCTHSWVCGSYVWPWHQRAP